MFVNQSGYTNKIARQLIAFFDDIITCWHWDSNQFDWNLPSIWFPLSSNLISPSLVVVLRCYQGNLILSHWFCNFPLALYSLPSTLSVFSCSFPNLLSRHNLWRIVYWLSANQSIWLCGTALPVITFVARLLHANAPWMRPGVNSDFANCAPLPLAVPMIGSFSLCTVGKLTRQT